MNRAVFLDTLYKLVTAGALVVLAYAEYRNLPPAPVPTPAPAPSPAPAPAPPTPVVVTPLGRSAKAYRDGITQEFADARQQVQGGTIKSEADLAAFMATHSVALQAAIKAACKAHSDPTGSTFNDPAGMAAELASAEAVLGGK